MSDNTKKLEAEIALHLEENKRLREEIVRLEEVIEKLKVGSRLYEY